MARVSRQPRTTPLATAPGELFFMDLFYSNVPSDNNRKWCLLFVDAYSRTLWSKFLTHKHEATAKVKEWVADREAEGILLKQWAELPKKKIKSDPGTEFAKSILTEFLLSKKITQELSASCQRTLSYGGTTNSNSKRRYSSLPPSSKGRVNSSS
jgi:hypothetical protein